MQWLNGSAASPQWCGRTGARLDFRYVCLQSGHASAHSELTLRAPRAFAWAISLLDRCPADGGSRGQSIQARSAPRQCFQSREGRPYVEIFSGQPDLLVIGSHLYMPNILQLCSTTKYVNCLEGQTIFFSMPSRLFGSAPPSEPFMILTSTRLHKDLFRRSRSRRTSRLAPCTAANSQGTDRIKVGSMQPARVEPRPDTPNTSASLIAGCHSNLHKA